MAAEMAGVEAVGEDTLERLCTAAEAEVTAWLRRGICADDCGGSFLCAAAMVAVSHYLATKALTVRSFAVGDVRVQTDGEGRNAQMLREQAERLMQPFCTGKPGFLGVRT